MSLASIILIAAVFILALFWVKNQPAQKRSGAMLKLILMGIALTLFALTISGRLHWLGAVIAGFLPFIRRSFPLLRFIPLLRAFYKQRQSNPKHTHANNKSEVSTEVIDMILDHDSGVMYGTIKSGSFSGKRLSDLSENEFIQLLNYCRSKDHNSARLLEAYLDKRFGDSWREDDTNEQAQNNQDSGSVSRTEALSILGLSEDATDEQIIEAHRKLIQKVHPDRGGSDYLAAKINEAKDRLLS